MTVKHLCVKNECHVPLINEESPGTMAINHDFLRQCLGKTIPRSAICRSVNIETGKHIVYNTGTNTMSSIINEFIGDRQDLFPSFNNLKLGDYVMLDLIQDLSQIINGLWEVISIGSTTSKWTLNRVKNAEIGNTIISGTLLSVANEQSVYGLSSNCIVGTDVLSFYSLVPKKHSDIKNDPQNTDDITQGFCVGSIWTNQVTQKQWVCKDNTQGFSVWDPSSIQPDFSDGGESLGQSRSIGNNDAFDLAIKTNNQNHVVIKSNGTTVVKKNLIVHRDLIVNRDIKTRGDICIAEGQAFKIGTNVVTKNTNFRYVSDEKETYTSKTTYEPKVVLDVKGLVTGIYELSGSYEWNGSSSSGNVSVQIRITSTDTTSGTTTENIIHYMSVAPGEKFELQSHPGFVMWVGTLRKGSHSITMEFKSENIENKAFIKRARLKFIRRS